MFDLISSFFSKKKLKYEDIPILDVTELHSYNDYIHHSKKHHDRNLANHSFEMNIIPNNRTKFNINGFCYVCKKYVNFLIDYKYSHKIDGVLIPNWRERIVCPTCHLNNRMRAVVDIFERKCHPKHSSKIFITEQTTTLYKWFKNSFSHVYGSEFLGDLVEYGGYNNRGIRNEDFTRLSFGDNEFDYILSFDVIEHIPNYIKALKECCRCLKPDGVFLFSVPFIKTSEKNIIRAKLTKSGELIHLLPAEYHGDPLNSDGCLCFYHFGWEILEQLNTLGFKDASALLYWSPKLGYLGGEQILFMATNGFKS